MPIMRGATKSPSGVETTAGFSRIASVERIATCGALMIGAVKVGAERAVVADGIGAAREIVGRQLARARLLDLPVHRLGEADQREIAGVAHDGNDEAVVREIDGDAEMDVARQRSGSCRRSAR